MNYAALEVDELARLCIVDAGARAYAGEHFAELVQRVQDEHLQQFDEAYEIAVDQAAGALLDQALERMTPWYDVGPLSVYWRIG